MSVIPVYNNAKKNKKFVLQAGSYPARLTSVIGLGIQEQEPYKGEAKSPAFTIDTAYAVYDPATLEPIYLKRDGEATEMQVLTFRSFNLFPGAQRGHAFDWCKAFDPTISEVPSDLSWFMHKLNEGVMVNIVNYETKQGEQRHKILSIQSMPLMIANQLPETNVELKAFDPYMDVELEHLFPHQVNTLSKALDARGFAMNQDTDNPFA